MTPLETKANEILSDERDIALFMRGVTEAEECHAAELQALKDKAVRAFCFCGICMNISSQVREEEICPFVDDCEDRKLFTQKLNEK